MILIKLFYAGLLIGTGVLMLKYRKVIKSWTGNFYWAEKYLWQWGTYLVLIMFWLFLIFWGILYPFWWLDMIFWAKWKAPQNIISEKVATQE